MPAMWINGERVDAKLGDTVLGAARQAGSHVWFLCDGRGLCLTCECQVLAGREHLNPPTDVEASAVSAPRRQAGFRLACQAKLTGNGDVSVLSRVEQIRRQFTGILSPHEGGGRIQSAGDLLRSSLGIAVGLVGVIPHVARHGVRQLTKSPPTVERAVGYTRDTLRLFRRFLPGPEP
jgi:ferredoxin